MEAPVVGGAWIGTAEEEDVVTKLHQLKPKPIGESGGSGTPETDPAPMPLQITLDQKTHVLIMKLGALWLEKGERMSKTSKSAIITAAVQALAKSEGLLP